METNFSQKLFLLTAVAFSSSFAPAAQDTPLLFINGHPSQVPILQENGHFYGELESLAHAVNGSYASEGGRIILTMPIRTSDAAPASNAGNPELSRAFLRGAIEAMASMREWHSALATAIQNQYPMSENWIVSNRNQASTSLRLASATASTDTDHKAVQLLTNEFNNLRQLSDSYVARAQSHTYIAPDSLESDTLDQKVIACGHSLAGMAASGQLPSDGACQ